MPGADGEKLEPQSLTQFLLVGFLPPHASHELGVKAGKEEGLPKALPSVNKTPNSHLPMPGGHSPKSRVFPGNKKASAPGPMQRDSLHSEASVSPPTFFSLFAPRPIPSV